MTEDERHIITNAVAQLRHAYAQLTAHDERWSRRGMQSFADGLIAPQIRRLEAVLQVTVEPSSTNAVDPSAQLLERRLRAIEEFLENRPLNVDRPSRGTS